MTPKRTIDLLTSSYGDEMSTRRKYEFKNAQGEKIVDLYFKPLTRYDRQKAQSATGTDEALVFSTQLLCQLEELEDGSKAFSVADAPILLRELPENVLNDIKSAKIEYEDFLKRFPKHELSPSVQFEIDYLLKFFHYFFVYPQFPRKTN